MDIKVLICIIDEAATATWLMPGHVQGATETVLRSFASPVRGAYPNWGLIRDSAGNIYGTTSAGGSDGMGVVFKVDSSGHQTLLWTSAGIPTSGVVGDAAGNLYGTNVLFGGYGGVYKLDTHGNSTSIHDFSGIAGSSPYGGVIRDSAGNFYGTTNSGGAYGWGIVYKLDAAGGMTQVYSFKGDTDGASPYAGVVLDPAGNAYGTTSYGGSGSAGVVFKMDADGLETVLYTFTGGPDGGTPYAGVVRDSSGNLYGTTEFGGASGFGVVYRLDPAGHYSVIHSFTRGADGGFPNAGVTRDAAGNLYGTTLGGGPTDSGVVYRIDPAGNETVLYTFTGGADGGAPYAGVVLDKTGNLYGTTYQGGPGNIGVIYTLDTTGHETVLYGLPGARTGSFPNAALIRDSAGNLYGTTYMGGTGNSGVVYELTSTGQERVLYNFSGASDGGNPSSGLVRDRTGNFYGTTSTGGAAYAAQNCGVVYKLDTAGRETVLHSFAGAPDGCSPRGGAILDSAGNLYGTTYNGGSGNVGMVFRLDPVGSLTVLYNFTGGADGSGPRAGVIRYQAGNLYGTTDRGGSGWGVAFKLDTAGHEAVLYTFTGGADGGHPRTNLVHDPAGNLYGTTGSGGLGGHGVVYRLDPSGHETVLHSFTDVDGQDPEASLFRDSAGNLYGTTNTGGAAGYGVVYKLDTTGQETVLYNFAGGSDGAQPEAGVILDSAGNLYGTTYYGGSNGTGVIFKLTP